MPQRVGVVLAGGMGRRYGMPKAEVTYEGETLAERAAKTLWPHCASVLISVAHQSSLKFKDYDVVEDPAPGNQGPLAGISQAYELSGTSDLLVLACDYPLVDHEWMGALIEVARPDADLIMPTEPRGVDHPLIGIWRRTARPAVTEALNENRFRVRSILPDLDVHRVPAAVLPAPPYPRERLLNLNRAEDWKTIESVNKAQGSRSPRY